MKKKILGGLTVLAIAAVAAFNINVNTQEQGISSISLENVEALANYENNNGSHRCDAGGTGSNSCTITSSQIGGTGGGSISVSCSEGYYACCTKDTWGNLGAFCVGK